MKQQNRIIMNFKSLPATNDFQSKMLLKAGLNPFTADCYIEEDGHTIIARDDYDLEVAINYRNLTPSWSLSRLLEILPPLIYVGFEDYQLSINGEFLSYSHYENETWEKDLHFIRKEANMMSSAITMLLCLISEGKYINKEYLKIK